MTQIKHFYDDYGIMQYVPPQELVKAFRMRLPKTNAPVQIYTIMNLASDVMLVPIPASDYQQHPREKVLREIYKDFVGRGFLPNDFLLVAWHLAIKVTSNVDISGW